MSSFCGSCNACNYRTKNPKKDCKFGSKCTRDNCVFAHASPSGKNHMAGCGVDNCYCGAYACRDGIKCRQPSCKFSHPSKALKCTGQDNGSCIKLIDYVIDKLNKSTSGFLPASQLCADIKKDDSWADEVDDAGGFKYFCLDHDDKITWISDGGGGKVELAQKGAFPVGAQVAIKTENPAYGWGDVRSWSLGTVRSFSGLTYFVDFPEQEKWKCQEKDLVSADGLADRSKLGFGVKDPAFDKFGFVRNKGDGKFEFVGKDGQAQERHRGLGDIGFVHGAKQLSPAQPYFEATIIVNRANGVGIGLSEDSFFAGSMVGWELGSIGFHSDAGQLFYSQGMGASFGETSSTGDTIGCGILFDKSDKPQTIYFTRNKSLVGRFPLRTNDCDMLFPVVTSTSPAEVQVNLTATPPAAILTACTLKTFEFEAKYNDASNKFKSVTIKGPPNSKGETPVTFKGYKDTTWVPQHHLRKTDTTSLKEFSNLEMAFASAVDGDTIEVKEGGVHLTRDAIDIKTAVTVIGVGSAKPIVSCSKEGVAVLNIFADTLLQNICVKSVGGDKSKTIGYGGSAGIFLSKGNLKIEECEVSSGMGTAIFVEIQVDSVKSSLLSQLRSLSVSKCTVGPCGRNGIILDKCSTAVLITEVVVTDTTLVGISSNGGDVEIDNCVVQKCNGNACISMGGFDGKGPGTMKVDNSTISSGKTAFMLGTSSKKGDQKLIITGCTIAKCKVVLVADGPTGKIFFDKTNVVIDCTEKKRIENMYGNGAQIIDSEDEKNTLIGSGGQLAVERVLKTAIRHGVPTYNRGDHAGCAQIYTAAAEEGVRVAGDDHEAKGMLRDALQKARLADTPASAAWALRRAFDAINQRPQTASGMPAHNVAYVNQYHQVQNTAGLTDSLGGLSVSGYASGVKGAHEPAEAAPRQVLSKTNKEKTKVEAQQIDTSPLPKESAKTSKDASNVSAETTNFARYCRLLMDFGREVMSSIFKASYHKESNKQWTEACGPSFLIDNFPDGFSQRKLGKHLVDNIRAGKCEQWDITLLSSLLLHRPGYLKGIRVAIIAVETLREERNTLAHSADLLAKQSLTATEFEERWQVVLKALNTLMDQISPAQKGEFVSKIGDIAIEKFGQSALEPLFDRVHEDIKQIQDLAEDASQKAFSASEKADQALKIAEKAATVSQVARAILDSKVQDMSLPRDMNLTNQKRYRLFKQLGKGAMGTVFEGKLIAEKSDGTKVALKICDASSPERAEREADILKKLSENTHDNIVKFHDSAFEGKHLVIVMELIKGQSLDDWLEQRYSDGNSGVTFRDTQAIVKQLAEGMACVHSLDIAHRDLKPSNLMFDEVTGKLVIVDFGLSKQHNTNSTMTSANDQLGTLLYMSPEQLEGDVREILYPSDIWSIGIIWHEMLTNFTPFEPSATTKELGGGSGSRSKRRTFSKREEVKMLNAVLEEGNRKLPMLGEVQDMPKSVIDMIAKCLNADKQKRYQDAQALFNHLTEVFEELEREPQSPSKVGAGRKFQDWGVDEVFELVRSISEAFTETAGEMKMNGIDGKYFLDMLQNEDEDLTTSIADGGLGFKRLQLRVVKAKIKELE